MLFLNNFIFTYKGKESILICDVLSIKGYLILFFVILIFFKKIGDIPSIHNQLCLKSEQVCCSKCKGNFFINT
jgi:hypothetical protein